jgi:hypothetical protein
MSDPTDQGNDWVADYVASYHYRYAWFILIFPLFGLFAMFSVWRSGPALVVAATAEALFILVFF